MKSLFVLALVSILWLPFFGNETQASVSALTNPFAGAPACATHNPRAFHGLWNYTLGCHYSHEHGDSPYTADDVFGTSYYAIAGGAISYPWATPMENDTKHNSYKWIVRTNLGCFDNQYITSPGCITDFRTQVHADLFNVMSDYHSMALEARVCLIADPTNCGFVRLGGWQYTGDFTIDNLVVYDRPDLPYLPTETRQIHAASVGDPRNDSWYMGMTNPLSVRVAHRTQDAWGYYALPFTYPVTTSITISDYHFFCDVDMLTGQAPPNCVTNGSKRMPDVVSFQPGQIRATIDPDNNLVADYSGHTDRYGNIVSGCTAIALDCVPISFEHVPLPLGIWYQWRVPFTDTVQPREYDFTFNGQPKWLDKVPKLMATLTLQPDETAAIDCYVLEDTPSTATPNAVNLLVSGTAAARRNALLKFTLTTLSGKVILSAQLVLCNITNTASNVSLPIHAIKAANSAWVEGATWQYAVPSTVRWAGDTGADAGADAGCSVADTDYNGSALGTMQYLANTVANTAHTIDLDTTQMAAMVIANAGMMIRRATTGVFSLNSSGATTVAFRPQLVVIYVDILVAPTFLASAAQVFVATVMVIVLLDVAIMDSVLTGITIQDAIRTNLSISEGTL